MVDVLVIDASRHFPKYAEAGIRAVTIKNIVAAVTTQGRNQNISDDARLALGIKYDRSTSYYAKYNRSVHVDCMRFNIHVHNAKLTRWNGQMGSGRTTSMINIPVVVHCKKLSDYSLETWTAGFQSLFAEIAQIFRSNAWVGLDMVGLQTKLVGSPTLMGIHSYMRHTYDTYFSNMMDTGVEATNGHSVNDDQHAVVVRFGFDFKKRAAQPKPYITRVCHSNMPVIWTPTGGRGQDRSSRIQYRQMRKRFVDVDKTGGKAYFTNIHSYHDFVRLVYDNINGPWTYVKRTYGVIDAEDATLLKVAGLVDIK